MITFYAILFIASQADLFVYSPDALVDQYQTRYPDITPKIPVSLGNFGNPPYGSNIVGRVHYLGDPQAGVRSLACDALPSTDWHQNVVPGMRPILLIDRGQCSFVQKVRHAQNIGAVAVLIADNTEEDVDLIVMSDDGTGGNLNIPCMLLDKKDASIMKAFFQDERLSNTVTVKMTFEMDHPSNHVNFNIWMSPDTDIVRAFLHEFAREAVKFEEDELHFTPRFVTVNCPSCSDVGYEYDHQDCVSGGRYCSPDQNGYNSARVGRDVVMESLRQVCISKLASEERDQSMWWHYIRYLNETCSTPDMSDECSSKALHKAHINEAKINQWIEDSFTGDNVGLDDNTILRRERFDFINQGVFFSPMLLINNQTFRGDIESDEVLTAICAGFKSKIPKPCMGREHHHHKRGGSSSDNEGISIWTILSIIVLSLLFLVLILYCYRRWLKRQMNSNMKNHVDEAIRYYVELSESQADN